MAATTDKLMRFLVAEPSTEAGVVTTADADAVPGTTEAGDDPLLVLVRVARDEPGTGVAAGVTETAPAPGTGVDCASSVFEPPLEDKGQIVV